VGCRSEVIQLDSYFQPCHWYAMRLRENASSLLHHTAASGSLPTYCNFWLQDC